MIEVSKLGSLIQDLEMRAANYEQLAETAARIMSPSGRTRNMAYDNDAHFARSIVSALKILAKANNLDD